MKPTAFYIAVLLTLFPVSWVGSCSLLYAHEFETGHIERSIDVIVRGQDIQVKYSLGLADETIVNWLVAEEAIEKKAETRFRKCIADLESQTKKAEAEKKTEVQEPLIQEPPKQRNAESVPPAGAIDADGAAGADVAGEVDTEPLAFQTELMQLLREKLSDSVCENLQLTIDGKQLKFADLKVSDSAPHPVAMEILLSAELPTTAATVLSFVDRNFLEVDEVAAEPAAKAKSTKEDESAAQKTPEPKHRYFGNVRLACRVKGMAVQLHSNVAPVLARAKPTDLANATLQERIEAATIRTKIGFAKPSQD